MIRLSKLVLSTVTSAILATCFLSATSFAGDLAWSGYYRLEGLSLNNARLDTSHEEKSYILHHLVLSPKIIAADSVQIFSRFDVFNNNSQPSNQAGQFMGQPPCTSTASYVCPASSRAVNSTSQSFDTIQVSQLWLRWTPYEFGEFIAGRVPVNFGLGMTYSAGNGLFDHFMDTKDMIAYKFIFGNIFLMPMYGKVASDVNHNQADITDYMIQAGWENPETDLSLGIFYDQRMSGKYANDDSANSVIAPTNPPTGAPAQTEGFTGKQINIFVKRNSQNIKAGVEAGFQSGKTGVTIPNTADANNETSLNGFGVAAEVKWRPDDSKNTYELKAGYASGTDPNATSSYGNFYFNKNYDIALILFNHYLGQPSTYSSATGQYNGGANVTNGQNFTGANNNTIDNDQITNAVYLAPAFHHALSENFDFDARLTWAMLNKVRVPNWSNSLGTEVDLGLEWRPFDRMTTRLDGGVLVPGSAYSMGGTQPTNTAFALMAAAAVTF